MYIYLSYIASGIHKWCPYIYVIIYGSSQSGPHCCRLYYICSVWCPPVGSLFIILLTSADWRDQMHKLERASFWCWRSHPREYSIIGFSCILFFLLAYMMILLSAILSLSLWMSVWWSVFQILMARTGAELTAAARHHCMMWWTVTARYVLPMRFIIHDDNFRDRAALLALASAAALFRLLIKRRSPRNSNYVRRCSSSLALILLFLIIRFLIAFLLKVLYKTL